MILLHERMSTKQNFKGFQETQISINKIILFAKELMDLDFTPSRNSFFYFFFGKSLVYLV